MIRVKRFVTGGISKTAEQKLEDFLNEIGEDRVINILKGDFYNQMSKGDLVSYTVIYRE